MTVGVLSVILSQVPNVHILEIFTSLGVRNAENLQFLMAFGKAICLEANIQVVQNTLLDIV